MRTELRSKDCGVSMPGQSKRGRSPIRRVRKFAELGEKLGLQPFLREFHKFPQLHRLNESLCDGNWWFTFLYYYLVIQDCPLKGRAKSDWMFDRVVLLDPDFTVCSEWLCMQGSFYSESSRRVYGLSTITVFRWDKGSLEEAELTPPSRVTRS
jgi:hypothetical protein